MKKIILSLVFILGITTMGNAANTLVANNESLQINILDLSSDDHLATKINTPSFNNICFEFAADVFIAAQKSGESFETSLTLFYQMKKTCETLVVLGLALKAE